MDAGTADMTIGYERPLLLIFPQSEWESRPFEIRLLHSWFGGQPCDRSSIAGATRVALKQRGSYIVCNHPGIASDTLPLVD